MPKKNPKAAPKTEKKIFQTCHVAGCTADAEYKAPKSRDELHRYEWYCLEHIREYNRKWDFFSDMSRPEIEAFMQEALFGHRPTWRREGSHKDRHEQLHEALREFLDMPPRPRGQPRHNGISAALKKAMALLDIDYPYTRTELKKKYHQMVKKHHPDVNRGNRQAEEKFKEITAAYLCLSEHLQAS